MSRKKHVRKQLWYVFRNLGMTESRIFVDWSEIEVRKPGYYRTFWVIV